MPVNPFIQGDPLAPGGSAGWDTGAGAGAGGFGAGASRETDYGVEEQYEVVDIAEPSNASATATAPVPPSSKKGRQPFATDELSDAEIKRREAELAKREADVARRERAMAQQRVTSGATAVKNFPPCYPMVHHDIQNDIPQHKRSITKAGFYIYMSTVVCLFFNTVAVTIAVFTSKQAQGALAGVVISVLYVFCGIPGGWYLWYSRLYHAMMSDGAMSFVAFFCVFSVHIIFTLWSALAPSVVSSNWAHAGLFTALTLFTGGTTGDEFSAVVFFISTGLWGTLCFASTTYLMRVYTHFRSGGGEQRVAQGVVQGAAVIAAQGTAAQNGR